MFNGKCCDSFSLERGIREEDSLAPYLFILCVEGLVSLVKDAKDRGLIKGFSKKTPPISHILFANDSLIFFWAKSADYTTIVDIHRCHESYY